MLDVFRKELKYVLSFEEMLPIKNSMQVILPGDKHNGLEGYRVRSLYFDSLHDRDFEDKVDGYDKRQKIRLRIYDIDTCVVKLELKEKEGTSQRKRSLSLSRQEALQMINADYLFLLERAEPIAHWIYGHMMLHCYRPKCIVEYDRMAYYTEKNDTRITFDMRLRATESNYDIFDKNLVLYPIAGSNEVTLEVKFNGFLYTYIKNVLNEANRIQISNSKYCRARMISKKGRK